MPGNYQISDADAKAIKQMAEDLKATKEVVDRLLNEQGRDVQQTFSRKPSPRSFALEFNAIIDGNDKPDPDVFQWTYGWQRAELSSQGYGNWQAVTEGNSGDATDPDTCAINMAEEIPGMGVDVDALPDGFAPLPLPDGQPVRIRREVTQAGTVQHVIIAVGAPNAIAGTCPTP